MRDVRFLIADTSTDLPIESKATEHGTREPSLRRISIPSSLSIISVTELLVINVIPFFL